MSLDVNKVTTADGKFHVGMTQKEAYANKEMLQLFTFADHNGNKVIDGYEVERYNGPILVENVEDKSGRFIGAYSGFRSHGKVAGEIISSKEVEYYPGLKVEELSEKASVQTFRDIDVDANGELSKEELENYKDIVEHNKKLKELDSQTARKKDDVSFRVGFSGVAATIFTTLGIEIFATASISLGWPLLIGGAVTFGAVKLAQHLIEKNSSKKREAIEQEFQQTQASKTDVQYNPAVQVKAE